MCGWLVYSYRRLGLGRGGAGAVSMLQALGGARLWPRIPSILRQLWGNITYSLSGLGPLCPATQYQRNGNVAITHLLPSVQLVAWPSWSKALDLSQNLIPNGRKSARVRTSPLPKLFASPPVARSDKSVYSSRLQTYLPTDLPTYLYPPHLPKPP